MKKILLLLLIITVSCTCTQAQQSGFGNWLVYFGNAKINSKWAVLPEVQWRSYNIIDDREQLLLRTALQYSLSPSVSVAQGYAFVYGKTYNAAGKAMQTREHRVYQQLILKQQYGRLSLQHRYRAEERFIAAGFRLRLRYFLSGNLALTKPKMETGALYLSAYNEIFIYTDWPLYDRDRLYAGVGYMFSKKFRMEGGVMTQMQESKSRGQFNLLMYHSFDL